MSCVFCWREDAFLSAGRGGRHNLLVGECYVHGPIGGEAMKMMKQGEVAEEVYLCILSAGFVIWFGKFLFCP